MVRNNLFSLLMIASNGQASPANETFLCDLSRSLPMVWTERHPREGLLTDRFPGRQAASLESGIKWCREAMAEERETAEEGGWIDGDEGPVADYLADMAGNIKIMEEELAAL